MSDDFEYHITFPSADVTSEFEIEPVVVLFGWAGGADRHLAKYGKIYEQRGCITLRFVTSGSLMSRGMKNQNKIGELAEKVVILMTEMGFADHPVFFHTFSNGGGTVYQYVSELLRKKHEEFKVKGCIFDSAPARVSAVGFLKAAAAITPGNVIWKYFFAILFLLHTAIYDIRNFLLRPFHERFARKDLWYALLEEPNICPQLFMFSKADNICPWATIQEFADKRKDKGVNVKTVVWNDSLHVQHMMLHEEEYCSTVYAFVKECVNVPDGEE